MAFNSFFDTWATIFDDLGNPLVGRVRFLDYETSQLKLVYLDTALTTEAANPHYTDITGKLENQIFLGEGDYKCAFERFIGTGDMKTAPDTDFTQYKITDLNGKTAANVQVGTSLVVDTIAALRALTTPASTPSVVVLGYNAAGDIDARTYYFDAASTENDNYGTIIKCTSVATGRYKTRMSNVIDVREFGILTGTDSTKNSQLNALISLVNSSTDVKTIYFPAGQYHFAGGIFNFTNKVVLEKGVTFSTSGPVLELHIKSDYDIQSVTPLTADLANVNVYFDGAVINMKNKIVKSCWYGLASDFTNGDLPVINAIAERVTTIYDLYLTNYFNVTSGVANFNNNLYFEDGYIVNRGGDVKFNNIKLTNVTSTAPLLIAGGGSFAKFMFIGSNAKSSFFTPTATQTVLTCQNSSSASTFVFDSNVTFTAAFTDTNGFKFEYESGIISTQTTNAYAIFNTFKTKDTKMFADTSYIGLRNQDVKICYFVKQSNESPTTVEQRNGLGSALRCATHGNGNLDLEGRIIAIDTTIDIPNASSTSINLKVENGTVYLDAVATIFNVKCAIKSLIIRDFEVVAGTYNASLVRSNTAGNIKNLILDNVRSYGSNASSTIIGCVNGGLITNVDVSNCDITAPWLMNENGSGVSFINVHDNKNLSCGFNATYAQTSMSNNNISNFPGTTSYWNVTCINSALINSNRFYQTTLYLQDNQGIIDHVVTGNQFESTNAGWSRILYSGITANTIVKGSVIADNSFTGVLSAQTTMISYQGSFSGAHRMLITNNKGRLEDGLLVPTTKGSWQNAVLQTTSGPSTYRFFPRDNPECYTLPGAINVNSAFFAGYYNTSNEPGAYKGCDQLFTGSGITQHLILSFTNATAATPNTIYANVMIDFY